jgi:arylsulfatase A-like enzyme
MTIPQPFPKEALRHKRPHEKEWRQYDDYQIQTERGEAEIIRKGYKTYTHYGVTDNPFRDNDVIDNAVDIIRQRQKGSGPWCQYIGPLGPHDPYFVPQEYLDRYRLEDIRLPENFNDPMTDKPALYRRTREKFDQLTEREHREAIRHYLAFCTYEDALFGKVLEALEETGEADHTLVLYVSDHGDYNGEHGLWCKGLPCFKGAYHVPAVIRWPEGIAGAGRTEDAFITLADFAPTFLEIAGIKTGRSFAGKSLTPFFRNERPEEWQDAIFTQSNGNELYGIQRSVMTRDWKLVYNGFDYDELYDLRSDPLEQHNCAGDPAYEAALQELYKKLWRFARQVNDVCVNPYVMVSLASHGPGVAFTSG